MTRINWLALATVSMLSACMAPSTPSTPTPSPSTGPSSPASAEPSALPSTAASASPTATPSAGSAAALYRWDAGALLKAYDFNAVGGVFFNPFLDQIFVLDAVDDFSTTKRYLVRKFRADGTYVSTVGLAPEGKPAPDAVDAIAFDLSGTPIYTYRNDGAFSLLKLYTTAVKDATGYPVTTAEWGGVATVSTDGVFLNTALLSVDVEKRDDARRRGVTPDLTGGQIFYGIGEEDEPPKALFQVPDPFYPTRAMAFGQGGNLYLGGQTREGGFALKLVKSDQTVSDVASLPSRPIGMWRLGDGVLIGLEGNGSAARVMYLDAGGTLSTAQELQLTDGGHLDEIKGVSMGADDNALITATGFDAENRRISGLFNFHR